MLRCTIHLTTWRGGRILATFVKRMSKHLDIVWTNQFKKDYKLAMKRHLDIDLLDDIIRKLASKMGTQDSRLRKCRWSTALLPSFCWAKCTACGYARELAAQNKRPDKSQASRSARCRLPARRNRHFVICLHAFPLLHKLSEHYSPPFC